MNAEYKIKNILKKVDVEINGTRPWDIQVHNKKLYKRILSEGSLGFGEAYVDGWWDSDDISELINRIVKTNEKVGYDIETVIFIIKFKVFNSQKKVEKIAKHYDLENNFYGSFLDKYMQYSSAYFKDTDDLNTAQEQKLDLICKKLQLKKGDRVLDIGCGWGGFAKYAAEHYGCIVTGISISDEQIKYAKEFCKGLPVTILKKDYREVEGEFDKVLACEVFEHVGHKNYKNVTGNISNVLKNDGLALIQVTTGRNKLKRGFDPWLHKYIFPTGMLPTVEQINKSTDNVFKIIDRQDLGIDYEKTLLKWFENFDKSWPNISNKFDDKFYRMWKYYILMCSGTFRSKINTSQQIVLLKNKV